MFNSYKEIWQMSRCRHWARTVSLVLLGALIATGASAQSYNADGSRADGVAPAPKDSEIAAIVNDRELVIDTIANRNFLGDSGQLSDARELERGLRALSDSSLAGALRATSKSQLLAVLSGGSLPVVSGVSSGPQPLLGAADAELVYTPITPCRIFDTRIDTRGPMVAFETRNFAVQGIAVSNQGGDVADCPDIPFDPPAVVVTLTTAFAASLGFAVLWEANAPQPTAGSLGFNVGDVISNTTITPVCVSCGTQADVQVAVIGTSQIVGDVVGYFAPPAGCGPGRIEDVGVCVETSLRPITTSSVFTASADCEDEGGRLPSPGELYAIMDQVTGAGGGEHSDAFFFDTTFRNMRVTSVSTLVNATTITAARYRCVFDPFDL